MVSFYSSELGGIVNDPGMMGAPVDESLVHSGHGVYEKFRVIDGYVYQMGARVDRLMLSAAKANIQLPKKWSRAQLERIILETIAAGKILQGNVTVFLSIGRGSYGDPLVSPSRSAMYVIVSKLDESVADCDEYLRGWHVKTSPVPCKSPYFATLKSTDRFQDTMAIMDARVEGYQTGILIDEEGFVAGAPDANVAFLMEGDELVFPPVTHAVPTLSMLRLMEVSSFALADGDLSVSKISQRRISLEEAKSSKEAMLVGSQFPVMPIVKWDEHVIGEGDVGIVSLQLRVLLQADAQYSEKSPNHTEVPYGYLTGMEA
jgi:4-amino-4-deoxychorismate lyase